MSLSFDVRVHSIEVYSGRQGKTYSVRWLVDGHRFRDTFKIRAQAESFRADLLSTARRGEAFDTVTGRAAAAGGEEPAPKAPTWWDHVGAYLAAKWPSMASTYRPTLADALTAVTLAVTVDGAARPATPILRQALYGWAFNLNVRTAGPPTEPAVRAAADWLRDSSPRMDALGTAAQLRPVLDRLTVNLDGRAAAATTIARRRAALYNVLEYAVELEVFDANPLGRVRWSAPKAAQSVDRRVVVNPTQAKALLAAVPDCGPSAGSLTAFFGCLYYGALRPEEAVHLRADDCQLPAAGWGELILTGSAPWAGRAWTDDGSARQARQLKHRAARDTRPVPAPPELVALLRQHLDQYGTTSDGRLFRAPRGGPVSESTYGRVWRAARAAALTPAQAASPLAGRPYDLRHAAVSLWLNAGVAPQQVAEWAGHSVHVLLKVYAKCLDGEQATARRRVEAALRAA